MRIGKKLMLDEYFLKKVVENKYPNLDVNDERLKRLEHWSCFSDPDMSEHICNYSAKLKGYVCDYCRNNDELKFHCYRVCEISHICLAAFANRLKGEFDQEYFENLLTISYDELLLEIETLQKGGLEEEVKEEIEEVIKQEVVAEIKEEIKEEPEEVVKEEIIKEEVEEDLKYVSVKRASEIIGVSVPTMYNRIKKGTVEFIRDGSLKISVDSLQKK